VLRWQFDKATYQPGDVGLINFWLENRGDTYLCLTETGLQFEFQEKENLYYPVKKSVTVVPGDTQYISFTNFKLPERITGIVRYRVCYHLWEYDKIGNAWIDLGLKWGNFDHYVKVIPLPYHRAFISRGIRPEDRLVGDEIVEMIKEWGFETITVGIDVFAELPQILSETVRDQIIKSDCLIAIATPRYLDALTGLWKTLEWLHGEVGIAYGTNRPILILVDESVDLRGLPGELKNFSLTFSSFRLEELRQKLGAVMPSFREWIAQKRREEFLRVLGSALAPLIIGGIVGFLIGSSRR
jgi:hypothetical protein